MYKWCRWIEKRSQLTTMAEWIKAEVESPPFCRPVERASDPRQEWISNPSAQPPALTITTALLFLRFCLLSSSCPSPFFLSDKKSVWLLLLLWFYHYCYSALFFYFTMVIFCFLLSSFFCFVFSPFPPLDWDRRKGGRGGVSFVCLCVCEYCSSATCRPFVARRVAMLLARRYCVM